MLLNVVIVMISYDFTNVNHTSMHTRYFDYHHYMTLCYRNI